MAQIAMTYIMRKCFFKYVWTTTINNRHALKSNDQD